jgi:hypothetical protein
LSSYFYFEPLFYFILILFSVLFSFVLFCFLLFPLFCFVYLFLFLVLTLSLLTFISIIILPLSDFVLSPLSLFLVFSFVSFIPDLLFYLCSFSSLRGADIDDADSRWITAYGELIPFRQAVRPSQRAAGLPPQRVWPQPASG